MVEICKLELPEEVTLLPGASQYLCDLELDGFQVAEPQRQIIGDLSGRVLIVGAHPLNWLAELADSQLTILVRGIPDANQIATALPAARVFCGSLAAFDERDFDAVVALTDLSRVLSLEEEDRTWRSLYDDLASRVKPGGKLICGIENDRGLHRITAEVNPRAANGERDWNVISTWDRSRPRTLEQVAALSAGEIWSLYPCWVKSTVIEQGELDAGLIAARDAAIFKAAVYPLAGADPLWHVETAAAADRMRDIAAGWLLVTGSAPREAQVWRVAGDETATQLPAVNPTARSLMALAAERLAANDLPGLRGLLQSWAGWLAANPGTSADLGLTVITETGELATISTKAENLDPWAAIADLVTTATGRGWRTPWPLTMNEAAKTMLLAAFAGLPWRSMDQVKQLLVPLPNSRTELGKLDKQTLISRLTNETAQVHSLRSRENWNELQFVSTKLTRKVKNLARRIRKALVSRVKKLLG